MKQRILSACVGLVLLGVVLFFFDTWIFNAAIAAIVAIALYELIRAIGVTNRLLIACSCLYGALIPILPHALAVRLLPPVTFLYIALLLLTMIGRHKEISATQVGFLFFVSLALPFSITVCIYLRDTQGMPASVFYILFALAGAWLSDTGAYFVGRKFGKHRLAPQISPKKTVEGAVGGVVVSTALILLIAAAYQALCPVLFGVRVEISFGLLALFCPILSVTGMLGDLTASVIKRQNNIKDFGNIMPGHGGVMDRFDSVFFTAPMVYVMAHYFTLLTVI